jgi:formiminoglutamase
MTSGYLKAAFDWSGVLSPPHDRLFAHLIRNANLNDLQSGSVVLIGLPFDKAIRGRLGARFAPAALRSTLATMKAHSLADGPVELEVFDLGDVALDDLAVEEAHERVEAIQKKLLTLGHIPIVLGGDHSLTYPLCRPLLDSMGASVICFDAHLDMREVSDHPCSGSSFNRLLNAGLERFVLIGARDFVNSTYHIEKAKAMASAVLIIPAYELSIRNAEEVAAKAIDFCLQGGDSIYLSVDMDAADQAKAPGVSAPTPGGLSVRELMVTVRHICKYEGVKAMDMMEVSPPLDEGGRTVRAAAAVIASMLAGLSSRANRRS